MPLGRTVHHPRHSKIEHVPRRPESTLDALYREHASAARRYATTLTRSHEEVEDLMTGALLRVLAAIRRGEAPETSVRSFLFATMRRVQGEEARRPFAIDPVEPPRDAAGKPSRPSIVRGTHHNQSTVDRDTVTAAFRGLPARWQAVLVLTAADNRSLEEVADRLDISPAAASVLAFRAREGLRASYLEHGLQPAPDATCAPVRARLGRWGRGTLTEDERRVVNDHLRTCVDCDAAALWVTEESTRMRFVPIPVLLAAVWPSAKNLGAIGAAGGGITAPGALRISRGALVSAGTVVLLAAVSAAVALSPVGEWLSGSAAPHTQSGSSSLGPGADTPSANSPALSPPVATSRPTTATPAKSASPSAASARRSSSSSSSSSSRAVTSSQVSVVYSSAGRSAVVWRSTVRVGTVLQLSGLPAGTSIGGSASCASAGKAVDFTCTVGGVATTSIALSARGWWCSPVGTNSSSANGSADGHRLRFACSRL